MSTKNFLKSIQIKNFKSIKNIHLNPSRVNIFLGEPNTGKSNFLEALSFISALGHRGVLRDYLRIKDASNLFYKESLENKIWFDLKFKDNNNIKIKMDFDDIKQYRIWINNKHKGTLSDTTIKTNKWFKDENTHTYGKSAYSENNNNWTEQYKILDSDSILRRVKYYKFRDFNPKTYTQKGKSFNSEINNHTNEGYNHQPTFKKSLSPPFGENIYQVIKHSESAKNTIRDILSEFNLKLFTEKKSGEISIVKEDDGIYYSLPIYSLADTLQTMIFHKVAIQTSRHNVIAFEEPESHTFPYYTSEIGEFIAKDPDNQYFIATHNPYFVDAIFSKAPSKDLQIYIVKYENNQSKIYPLDEEGINILFGDDDDIFTTVSHFDSWPTNREEHK